MELMRLEDHYDGMWQNALVHFRQGNIDVDNMIDSPEDDRRGVTLLARPSAAVRSSITELLHELEPHLPGQYFYPTQDMHVTVLSVITCVPGFSADQIEAERYLEMIRDAIKPAQPFDIDFRGLTAAPAGLMIRGYPKNDSLAHLRDSLRNSFRASSLHHTIDQRYRIETAHITALRFRKSITDPESFVDRISLFSNRSFGSCTIDRLELVENDWYQRRDNQRQIGMILLA